MSPRFSDLTARQREIYDFIVATIESRGFAPSSREICREFGFGPRAATDHLRAMAKKGVIVVSPRTARGIAVVDEPLPDTDIEYDRLVEENEALKRDILVLGDRLLACAEILARNAERRKR